MLKVVADESAIRRYQRQFVRSLKTAAVETIPVKLGHPGASEKAKVAWSERLGTWFFSRKLPGSRYWNGFGIGRPEGGEHIERAADVGHAHLHLSAPALHGRRAHLLHPPQPDVLRIVVKRQIRQLHLLLRLKPRGRLRVVHPTAQEAGHDARAEVGPDVREGIPEASAAAELIVPDVDDVRGGDRHVVVRGEAACGQCRLGAPGVLPADIDLHQRPVQGSRPPGPGVAGHGLPALRCEANRHAAAS